MHLPCNNIEYKPECDFGKHKPYQADSQEGLYLEDLLIDAIIFSHAQCSITTSYKRFEV
jgi:hypothetical protein